VLRHAVTGDFVGIERVAARPAGQINADPERFRFVLVGFVQACEAIAGDAVARAANQEGVE
jgi:hypothetical protein